MTEIGFKQMVSTALVVAMAGAAPTMAQPVGPTPANPFAGPVGHIPYPMPAAAPAPPLTLALKAAQGVAAACGQYKLGIAVVNAKGEPVLIYLPDGSPGNHSFMAFRKAYTAASFGQDSSSVLASMNAGGTPDKAILARFTADPVMIKFKGGLVWRRQGQIVGAIGVSGAEPGGHDEACGKAGLATIASEMDR